VFDDMHKGGLRRDINNVFSGYDHKKIDIKKYSLDRFKRFSSLYYNISKI
jgi:hypothetical protein